MDFDSKISRLQDIYRQYEEASAEFRQAAVCKPGCAYCCTEMGTVDITTLEGLQIRERLGKLKRPVIAKVTKRLNRDIRKKEQGEKNRCPFLQKNDRCQIYAARPFSCRQLYSLQKCGAQGPTVHRQAVELARDAIARIQAVDDTGYSGHLSYILHMLGSEKFRQVYRAGDCKPEEIMLFGKSHKIIINRMLDKK
ncbi:MAG: YkgJ family cysteine cluster protein [Desulfobacterales bacterium]|nr:YkgJ family cysteine cluster protein [Desulfobacterales bacterium]